MKINEFIPNNYIYSSLRNINTENTENEISIQEENNQSGFSDILKNKLDEVNDKQIEAEITTESFIKGESTDIHEVMIKTEEAKLSLQLAVQIRNKLVEAYQEINRMQV
jgi:flagellar hook-basal body complex protein FliE